MKLLRWLFLNPLRWGYNSTGLDRVFKLLKKKVLLLGMLLNPRTYKKVLRGEIGGDSVSTGDEEKVVPKNIQIMRDMTEERKQQVMKKLNRQKLVGYFILLCTLSVYLYFIVSPAPFDGLVLHINAAAMSAYLVLRIARFSLAQQQLIHLDLVPVKVLFQDDEKGSWVKKWWV